jgi:hypothetical protein
MKRLIIAAIAAMLALVSCEKETANAIVGTWEATKIEMNSNEVNMNIDVKEAGINIIFAFRADGKGSVTENMTGEESYTEEFNYFVNNNMLIIAEDGEEFAIPFTINGKTLVLTVEGENFDAPGATIKMYFNKK